eukprot:COSAG04_NODE_2737_length_3655_cov_3.399606_2_plen_333_part_00
MAGLLASLGLRDRLPVLLPRLGDSGDPRSQLFDLAETLTPELREMELVMEEMGLRDEAGRGPVGRVLGVPATWGRKEEQFTQALNRVPTARRLREAAQGGDVAEVARLCETGMDIDQRQRGDPFRGDWALQLAAQHGRVAVMRTLIDAKADVDRRRHRTHGDGHGPGDTALMAAAQENQWGAAKLLLAAGANHAVVDSNGDSALDWAQRTRSVTTAQVLAIWAEAETAEAKKRLLDDWAAGMHAGMHGPREEALRQAAGMHGRVGEVIRLLEDGADHTAEDEYGDAALAIAKAYANQPAVEVLEEWASCLALGLGLRDGMESVAVLLRHWLE